MVLEGYVSRLVEVAKDTLTFMWFVIFYSMGLLALMIWVELRTRKSKNN